MNKLTDKIANKVAQAGLPSLADHIVKNCSDTCLTCVMFDDFDGIEAYCHEFELDIIRDFDSTPDRFHCAKYANGNE